MPALTNPGILGLNGSETVTMRSDLERMQSRGRLYRLLLGLCLLVMASFGFPSVAWLGSLGYTLIALLLTQLVMIRQQVLSPQDRLYQCLGILALVAQLLWLLTPVHWQSSGVPLVLSWSVLVGWSVVRLVRQLAREHHVNDGVLMGAAAGYLLLGLTAGLVMIGVETIQPGSFEPLLLPAHGDESNAIVLQSVPVFAKLNYFAFTCLTTVGFGDITPALPLARMLAVGTGVIGPLYLAAVMGVLISRYTGIAGLDRPKRSKPERS